MILRPKTTGRQRAALVLAALLSIAVVLGVQRFVGWGEVLRLAATLPGATWAAFLALVGMSYATRVVRLWRLLRDIHEEALLARSVPVFFVHNALVTLLPARLGEAAMPLLARRWIGADWAAAFGALAWWRVADLAVVAALALALLATGANVLTPLYAIATGACALPFGLFALRGTLLRVARRRSERESPRWVRLAGRVLGGMPARLPALAADLALAFVAWSTKIAGFATLIAGALAVAPDDRIAPPWSHVAAAALAGDAAGALPVPTIGGVGMFEAGIVLGLTSLGVPAANALAIAVLLHGAVLATIVTTGVAGLGAGLIIERRRTAGRG